MGTGPFTVAEWVRGDRIVLAKNKDYWVKGLPKLDRVTYRFIPDPNSALAALKAGDVDVSALRPRARRAWTSSRRTRASR